MNKSKRPQFKNPFDLDDDDEQIPIQQSYGSYNQQPIVTVHNPLPFNPYELSKQSHKNTQQTKSLQTGIRQPPKSIQPRSLSPTINYIPQQSTSQGTRQTIPVQCNQDGDPPLLQDIGIDVQLILRRMKLIFKLGRPDDETLDDPDLSGPIMIAMFFGFLLMLSGKLQFGDIYAIFVVGNILLYFLFNFMSQVDLIPLYNIMSTVGYALLPMLILGVCGIFSSLKGTPGILLSLAVSGWSSFAASNFIESLMRQTQSDRKPLLIYPLFLFYVSFAMIIIF